MPHKIGSNLVYYVPPSKAQDIHPAWVFFSRDEEFATIHRGAPSIPPASKDGFQEPFFDLFKINKG